MQVLLFVLLIRISFRRHGEYMKRLAQKINFQGSSFVLIALQNKVSFAILLKLF